MDSIASASPRATWKSPPPLLDANDIADMARVLASKLPLQAIVLFGSWARGQAGPNSDVDFLLVSQTDCTAPLRQQLHRQACELLWNIRAPIDILVCSPEQIARWREATGHVIGRAIREGQVLHGQL